MRPFRTLHPMLIIAALLGAPAYGEQPKNAAPPPKKSDDTLLVVPGTSSTEAGGGENCTTGCAKWGRTCDIDVRGVRKCHTVCEKFEEQCQ